MRLQRTIAIVLTLSLGLLVAGCSDPEKREAKYIRRGIELFNKEEYQKARLEFRNAGAIKPTDPEVRYRLGLVDEAEGELRNAFGNFIHAAEQDPHHHPAQLKIAQYYLAAEQFEEVEKRLALIQADTPDDPEAHALRAALALRRQNFDETEKEARFALSKDPGSITATSVLTGMYVAKNDEAKAAETLAAGIARNPNDVSLQVLKVAVYRKLNDPAKVEEAYRTIFTMRPKDRRYRIELAQYFISLNRLDDAEMVYRVGVSSLPEDWDMKRQLVVFLSEHRGLEAADKEVRGYMVTSPQNNDLYFWLADLYVKHRAVDRAVKLLEEVAAKEKFDPPGLNARTSLARISFARGDRALGEKLVAIVLENSPGNRDALFMRAAMEHDQGRYQAAVADLRSILRDQPRTKDALQLLAETLVRQGHLDLAADTLSQLVDIDPLNNAARVRLAQMVHLTGDSKRALALLALVTKADPSYPIGWESTARIATDVKDWPAAEAAIGKLAALDGQKLTAAYLHGMVLAGSGKTEEAGKQFAEVISADPNTPLAEHALTSLVAGNRALKRTETTCHFIETLNTDSVFVMTVLGECYAELNRLDDSAKTFDKVIAANPPRPEPYIDRARLYLVKRDAANAMEVLKKGAAAVPADVQMPMMLGDLLSAGGRYREAETIYDDLLARNPSLDAVANNLAEMLADFQYTDPVAMEKARRVAERFQGSSNPLLMDTLGWVYFRQGNLNQAVTLLERAVAQGQVPAQVHYHFAAVLAKLNRKDEAKAQLDQATRATDNYVGIEDAKRLLQSL